MGWDGMGWDGMGWDGMGCQEQKCLNTISDVCLSLVSINKHFTSKER